jgi:hypothetical protein
MDELRSLLGWLRHEDALRGRVQLEPVLKQTGGQMGGWLEVLTVSLGSGGVGVVLAASLSTYLTHRRSDVTLKITGRDGTEIEFSAQRVRDVPQLLNRVERLLDRLDGAG